MSSIDMAESSGVVPMEPAHRFTAGLRKASLIGTYCVLAASCAVVAGHLTGSSLLMSLSPDAKVVQASTAISLMVLSIAFLLLQSNDATAPKVIAARALSGFIAIAAAATLVEIALGQDWGLNHTWWRVHEDSAGLAYPGPMAPTASGLFIALAVALFLRHDESENDSKLDLSEILSACVAFFCTFLLICLSSGVDSICSVGSCVKIAPVTAIVTGIFALSLLVSQPRKGWLAYACADTVGGALTRWMLCIVVTLPVLLWLRSLVANWDVIGGPLSWCAFGAAVIAECGFMVAKVNARIVEENSKTKEEFEEKLRQAAIEASQSSARPVLARPEPKYKLICLQCAKEFNDNTLKACPDDGNQLTRLLADEMVGNIFADKYDVVELLGQGGMSSVYRANHTMMPVQFAIKVLRPHLESDKESILRFHHEAKASSLLKHPNLIGIHDFGFSADCRPYIVMDFLNGVSLRDVLNERHHLKVEEAIHLFMEILSGLGHAHNNGIIHRDIKPSNIMLTLENGKQVTKIVDFGLAKMTDSDLRLTATGNVVGSPLYMSPEQNTAGKVDQRSDIYSLGCVMYECLAGEPPFMAETVVDIFRMHHDEMPPPFDPELELPEWLIAAVFTMLQKNPARRFESIDEIIEVFKLNSKSSVRISAI